MVGHRTEIVVVVPRVFDRHVVEVARDYLGLGLGWYQEGPEENAGLRVHPDPRFGVVLDAVEPHEDPEEGQEDE